MAKKEDKVEKTKVEKKQNKPKDSVTKVDLKSIKPKEAITKVDFSKPLEEKSEKVEKEPVEEKEVVVVNEEPKVEKVEEQKEEQPVIEEVSNEEVTVEQVEEQVEEAIVEAQETGKPLPENIQKVVEFMEETGGTLNDYVNLNRDISKMDDSEVLDEYYRNTKSHLSPEERNFILEEKFSYDEETDDPKDIKRKKIALKEQVAEARSHLDGQKSKYYKEVKAGQG